MVRQFPGKTIKQRHIKAIFHLSLFLTSAIMNFIIISCTPRDEFVTGGSFVESATQMAIVDTFKVDMSTVLVDSVSTSGTGIAFAGGYSDRIFGAVKSEAYFEPGYAIPNIPQNAVYDSTVAFFKYSGFSFGDTLSPVTLSLHRLNERITTNINGYLYNRSHFDYSDTASGTVTFYPRPGSSDTVRIAINDFGEKLFGKYKNNDADLSTDNGFLNWANGFVLKSDSGNAIIGFLVDKSQTFLKLYYHVSGIINVQSIVLLTFGVNTSKQFNSISNDFRNSDLAGITASDFAVPSDQTGDMALLQAMVGLLPKVQFPTLQDIFNNSRWKVLRAELVFDPVRGSYDSFTLPKQLCLYGTNKYNNIGTAMVDASQNVILTSLTIDELYNENTSYTIDVTPFITAEFAGAYFNNEHALLIGLQQSEINKKFDRLQIECKNPKVKLRLYYLSY